jgi:hypothetical protein
MKYTFDREELEQFKTKILVHATDFITEIVKFKNDNSSFQSPYDVYPSATINLKKFSEMLDKFKENISETIKNL